ncbi:hypothetical protein JTB14_033011 [Gonioctena quinquepunctata]|nr:hypothetical protein JTB14_033011 [Gonioctena quinquepunctata]
MIWGDDDIANQVDEIFVELSEPNIDTDEDSADEENGDMLQNLTGRQLRSEVKLKLTNNDRMGSNHEVVSLANPRSLQTELLSNNQKLPQYYKFNRYQNRIRRTGSTIT